MLRADAPLAHSRRRRDHIPLGILVYINSFDIIWLTANVDFDLAEVEAFKNCWNLHNEVSARWHARGARQTDSGSLTHHTWILSTHVVVPQGGRRNCGRHVRQSNDEVIWAKTWNETLHIQMSETVNLIGQSLENMNDELTVRYFAIFSARCNIYISRLCYDVCVRLSVRLSVCDESALAHYS